MDFKAIKQKAIMMVMSVSAIAMQALPGKADLAGDLTNVTSVATSLTTMATSIMAVFMQPPLVIFVGLGIFVSVIGIVKRMLRR